MIWSTFSAREEETASGCLVQGFRQRAERYPGVHLSYSGVHLIYPGVHLNYTGVHLSYLGVHLNCVQYIRPAEKK
jgi:hypothetical protein